MHILLILISLLFLFNGSLNAQEKQIATPNVILIVSHGHGVRDLKCFGSNAIKTPNLDFLASESIRFTNAYGAAASVSANHSVILTGLYNHATGQYGLAKGYHHFSVFPELKSLPWYLKAAGYRTARIGRLEVAPDAVFAFDTILGSSVNERNTYEMAEHCGMFISAKKERPFFLYFCPADPYRSEDETDNLPDQVNRFGNREQGYDGIVPTFYQPDKLNVPDYLPDSPECHAEMAQYAQAVSRMDLGIGRLFKWLKKTDNWENTLIIYISDGGASFPISQGTLYEPAIHLPCLIKLPFEKSLPLTCDAIINWADLAPTILDYAQAIPVEYPFHGRSFKNIIMQEQTQGWDETYASNTFHDITMYYPMRMIINRHYKLIWNIAWQLPAQLQNNLLNSATWLAFIKSNEPVFGKRNIADFIHRPQFELYDISNDPDEMKNLASNPEYITILEDLKARLKNFQVKTNDPWIIQWN